MKRFLGFGAFFIALGMILMLFIDNIFATIIIILLLFILGIVLFSC